MLQFRWCSILHENDDELLTKKNWHVYKNVTTLKFNNGLLLLHACKSFTCANKKFVKVDDGALIERPKRVLGPIVINQPRSLFQMQISEFWNEFLNVLNTFWILTWTDNVNNLQCMFYRSNAHFKNYKYSFCMTFVWLIWKHYVKYSF